jgi:hypothetical protein
MAEEQVRKEAKVGLDPTPSTSKVSNTSTAAVSCKSILSIADRTLFTEPLVVAPHVKRWGKSGDCKGSRSRYRWVPLLYFLLLVSFPS